MMRVSHRLATAAALLATAACGDDRGPQIPLAPSATVTALVIVSGNNQTAKAGEPFAAPLVARVTDAGGKGVGNVEVLFRIAVGSGGLIPKTARPVTADPRASAITGPDGTAYMTVVPFEVGSLSVVAEVPGSGVPPAAFNADVAGVVIEFRSPRSFGDYASFYGPCQCPNRFTTTTVPVGTVVEWKSADDESYTVRSRSAPVGGAPFESGRLGRSSRFRFVPNTAGTWDYYDAISGISAMLIAR